MKRYQEEWFQDKLDDINEVESHVMESKEFLDAKRQLEEIKSKIKAQVPEAERSAIDLLFDSMDEINLSVYNMLMEKIVCATKFDDFFAYNSITRILPSSLVHGSADRALVAKTFEGYRQITA